ncbi:Thiol peroxidase, Tpx-type (EC [Olavius algarvensis associated proteobacterium Delta 3]|nr:Thiol peroxidase, Tpx-type (EC [Olavius algarvensis associated proteobacterium Delta 3]CAB5148789.1 Thiol peroxidase, Tpx-type (EC [Olavius algarvensis associated proteobacterium Delta 3]
MGVRTDVVTWRGEPMTLGGNPPAMGAPAPDVILIDNYLAPFALSSLKGKICVVSAVPSLDTPTCDMETRRFNSEAASLGDDVVILTVSMDLPYAQKRWCGAAGVDRVVTLSDHRDGSFGEAYGVMIGERRLLTRAVFVIDREGILRYEQIVPEIAQEPDYDAVIEVVRDLL